MNLLTAAAFSLLAFGDVGPDSPCPKPPPAIREASEIRAKNEKPPEPIDPNKIPAWMETQKRIGDGPNQINKEVLTRARKLYAAKVKSGQAKNACYLAMDATRPNLVGNAPNVNPDKDFENATLQTRAYLICESLNLFIPMSSSHGSGDDEFYDVKEKKPADVFNGRTCARFFGNANGSLLTTGGAYMTGDLDQIYKGRQVANGHYCDYTRPFLEFNGEPGTDTANARPRDIGAHPAILVKKVDKDGPGCWCDAKPKPIFYGQRKDYAYDRSNGCLATTEAMAMDLLPLMDGHPTSVYIYPESKDIQAINSGDKNTYWNKTCLDKIQSSGGPRFIRDGEYSEPPKPPGEEPPPKPKTMCSPEICALPPYSGISLAAPAPADQSTGAKK